MYQETMNLIHLRANERRMLYSAGAKHHLSPQELQRLHELNGELPDLWDRYRREFAARNHSLESTPLRRAA
jgi:hypothetical protein